eukprot:CAMPEP_0114253748 /NCGR_PEP_ID=MMETSP0058-20121206/16569_1 /TAXON_ID=36894 /ORGANISM="Pyramimonas parkeae, CCMP726" /LENGTH=342 /DNA_ID=CAMNT_0001367837 /DNA_START=639 /DNA_END=1664 /DNA_ORIENTATION=-
MGLSRKISYAQAIPVEEGECSDELRRNPRSPTPDLSHVLDGGGGGGAARGSPHSSASVSRRHSSPTKSRADLPQRVSSVPPQLRDGPASEASPLRLPEKYDVLGRGEGGEPGVGSPTAQSSATVARDPSRRRQKSVDIARASSRKLRGTPTRPRRSLSMLHNAAPPALEPSAAPEEVASASRARSSSTPFAGARVSPSGPSSSRPPIAASNSRRPWISQNVDAVIAEAEGDAYYLQTSFDSELGKSAQAQKMLKSPSKRFSRVTTLSGSSFTNSKHFKGPPPATSSSGASGQGSEVEQAKAALRGEEEEAAELTLDMREHSMIHTLRARTFKDSAAAAAAAA